MIPIAEQVRALADAATRARRAAREATIAGLIRARSDREEVVTRRRLAALRLMGARGTIDVASLHAADQDGGSYDSWDHALRGLVRAGCAVKYLPGGQGPGNRCIYRITELGREALAEQEART